jgi:hypothetical protein
MHGDKGQQWAIAVDCRLDATNPERQAMGIRLSGIVQFRFVRRT